MTGKTFVIDGKTFGYVTHGGELSVYPERIEGETPLGHGLEDSRHFAQFSGNEALAKPLTEAWLAGFRRGLPQGAAERAAAIKALLGVTG